MKNFRIDLKKWKAAVEVVLESRQNYPERYQEFNAGKITWRDVGYANWAEQLTKLYSIRAHARGKLHRKIAKITYYEYMKLNGNKIEDGFTNTEKYKEFVNAGGKIKMSLTIEDQQTYIGEAWKKFEFIEKSEQIIQPVLIKAAERKWWKFWD